MVLIKNNKKWYKKIESEIYSLFKNKNYVDTLMFKCFISPTEQIITIYIMKKLKEFLENWITFEVYDTETEGIYEIYAGISKDGIMADLSTHGFNLYFGNNKTITKNHHEYGFKSVSDFKKGAILSLYYISRISAEEIVGEYIINAIRKGKAFEYSEVDKYIWEGKSEGCPEKWSVYMDLRGLE